MKNEDNGPIFNKTLRKNKREDIKEEKTKKNEDVKKGLPEGNAIFNQMHKDLEDLQIKIDSFNREVEDLSQKNRINLSLIYDKCQVKYEEISKKFNEKTKELLDEFDIRRKELEKFAKKEDILKYTSKMKKLYGEMQEKWEELKKDYAENEKKAKELEEKEIKKIKREYNLKLAELKKKYNLS